MTILDEELFDLLPFVVEPKRHKVLRRGEREPIEAHKRRLIFIRDGYNCGHCGYHVEPDDPAPGRTLDIDHIVPWSAFPPNTPPWIGDRSDNLRTLCMWCNNERSNFQEPNPPRALGVTPACYWCVAARDYLPDLLLGVDPSELDHIPAFCGIEGATSWVPYEGWIL